MIVILNARAGNVAKSANLQSMIARLFGAAGLNAEVISVAGKNMSAAVRQAVARDHEMIVAAGGDGTVSTVAAELVSTEKILGVLQEMLLKIADVYDDEVDNAVAALTSMLEPIMIVFLAVIVGTIVLALFTPLISIITGLQQQT